MRRIAYWLVNKAYEALILEFCETEGLLAVDISSQDELTGNFVFFITDSKETAEEQCGAIKSPCCLISDDIRNSSKYYVISSNFKIFSLRMLMDQIYHGGTLWNTAADVKMESLLRECYVGNDVHDVERMVYQMTWELMYFCPFSDIEKIRIGFSEMLINAIEHGNLGITNSEKHEHTEAGTFYELLEKRKADPAHANKRARVKMQYTSGTAKITIRDEGEGFDTSASPNPQNPEDLLKLHGRGILITKAYFDSVTYNKKGNEVTLHKIFAC